MPSIVLVAGDTGGARTALALSRYMLQRGWEVITAFDPQGEGKNVLVNLATTVPEAQMLQAVKEADLLYVATCSTAYQCAHRAIAAFDANERVLFGVDGYFNHCFTQWRDRAFGHWFAADEWHAEAIARARPDLAATNVHVTGLPAFDDLAEVATRKERIRQKARQQLGVGEKKVVLWWSHGTAELISEDIEMVREALGHLPPDNLVFVPRLHPKLDAVMGGGYIAAARTLLTDYAASRTIECISADAMDPTELDLAADVLMTAISSEATKCVLVGAPPVVHLLGPRMQSWFAEFGIPAPYIPYLASGRALVARTKEEVAPAVARALLGLGEAARPAPVSSESSAKRFSDILERLVK